MTDCFVFDDWLLHDLAGDNGEEAQSATLQFLIHMKEKCDSAAMLMGTSWASKAYALMERSEAHLRQISKFLHNSILLDAGKFKRLQPTTIGSLPPEIGDAINPADLYLFQTYFAANTKALVSRDQRLIDSIHEARLAAEVNILHRDVFLADYPSK